MSTQAVAVPVTMRMVMVVIMPVRTLKVIVHGINSNWSSRAGTAPIGGRRRQARPRIEVLFRRVRIRRTPTVFVARVACAAMNEPAGHNSIDSPGWPAYHGSSLRNELSRGVHSDAFSFAQP